MTSGNAFDLSMTTVGTDGTPLRLQTFYFPGWEVLLDGETRLDTYPSTSLGLLTVDLPAGEHRVDVRWAGTTIQRLSAVISLLALVALAWVVWRRHWKRGLVVLPLLFVAFGLVAAFSSPAMEPISRPAQPLQTDSLTLLGYRQQQTSPDFLTVYPYWQVTAPAPPDLQLHWRIQDDAGSIVSDFRSSALLQCRPCRQLAGRNRG